MRELFILFPFLYLLVFIIGFCLTISPLVIWYHVRAISKKLDRLIALGKQKGSSE